MKEPLAKLVDALSDKQAEALRRLLLPEGWYCGIEVKKETARDLEVPRKDGNILVDITFYIHALNSCKRRLDNYAADSCRGMVERELSSLSLKGRSWFREWAQDALIKEEKP